MNLTFMQTNNRGLGYKIVVQCDKCSSNINAVPVENHAYEINRCIIFAMRLLGIGIQGIIKFFAKSWIYLIRFFNRFTIKPLKFFCRYCSCL